MLELLTGLAKYAPAVALAAFAGTFLGGMALSFFWKHFGPWKLLEESKRECADCREDREQDARDRALLGAQIADLSARHEILLAAVQKEGLGLRIGPMTIITPINPIGQPRLEG